MSGPEANETQEMAEDRLISNDSILGLDSVGGLVYDISNFSESAKVSESIRVPRGWGNSGLGSRAQSLEPALQMHEFHELFFFSVVQRCVI